MNTAREPWRTTIRVEDVYGDPAAPAYASIMTFPAVDRPHAHEFLEIMVVVSGAGTHVSASGTLDIRPGTLIVVRPGAWHSIVSEDHLTAAIIGISLSTLRADLSFLRARAATRDLLYAGPIGAAERGIWISELSAEVALAVAERVRRLAALLVEQPDAHLMTLGELISVLGSISVGMSASEAREHVHPAVAEVLELLDAEPERNWRVTDLGAAVHLDVAYLTRIFRDHVGLPPIAYLARVRVEKAARLLAITDLSVAQVAIAVGWQSATYFARRFQSLIGLTPTDYRRQIHAGGVPSAQDFGARG